MLALFTANALFICKPTCKSRCTGHRAFRHCSNASAPGRDRTDTKALLGGQPLPLGYGGGPIIPRNPYMSAYYTLDKNLHFRPNFGDIQNWAMRGVWYAEGLIHSTGAAWADCFVAGSPKSFRDRLMTSAPRSRTKASANAVPTPTAAPATVSVK